jgi:vacuolar-type H+-ATPase subunit F/Vma7
MSEVVAENNVELKVEKNEEDVKIFFIHFFVIQDLTEHISIVYKIEENKEIVDAFIKAYNDESLKYSIVWIGYEEAEKSKVHPMIKDMLGDMAENKKVVQDYTINKFERNEEFDTRIMNIREALKNMINEKNNK